MRSGKSLKKAPSNINFVYFQSSIAAQEDKAAKVATISQALVCINNFKKSQEEKDDRGGPNASEMNDFATHLQEVKMNLMAVFKIFTI